MVGGSLPSALPSPRRKVVDPEAICLPTRLAEAENGKFPLKSFTEVVLPFETSVAPVRWSHSFDHEHVGPIAEKVPANLLLVFLRDRFAAFIFQEDADGGTLHTDFLFRVSTVEVSPCRLGPELAAFVVVAIELTWHDGDMGGRRGPSDMIDQFFDTVFCFLDHSK